MAAADGFCPDPLWVPFSITINSSLPNVSACFQHTVLTVVPLGFLLIFLPALIVQGNRIRTRFEPLPWRFPLFLRMAISLYLAVNSGFVLVYNIAFRGDGVPKAHTVDYIYPAVWIVFFLLQILIDLNRKRVGQVSSGIQHLSYVVLMICGAPEVYHWITVQTPTPLFAAFLGWWPIVVIQCLLYCFADARQYNEKTQPSPELDSSFANRLTIWWFTALPVKGAKKDLEMEDLFELNHGSTSEHLGKLFEDNFEPRLQKYMEQKAAWIRGGRVGKPPPLPSVLWGIFFMFSSEFLTATGLKLISDTAQFANPFLLNQLIGFVSDVNAPLWLGVSYAVMMFIVSEARSIILNAYFYIMFRMGIKIQTALTAAVYRKTMRLSNGARRQKTVGEIINLMAIDVDFLQMITPQIQQFWSCPYQICFALVYLFITLGYSASPGVVVMGLFVPINIFGSIAIKKWQMRQMALKDQRTKMVNEVLNGIKVIKLYAWEVPMEEHINSIRNRELDLIKKAAMVKSCLDTFNTISPFLVAASSFATFTLSSSDHILTPQIAFVSLTLFNQLRSPMAMVAMLINMLVQALVSNRRLKSFFVSDELDANTVERNERADSSPMAVEVAGLDATWDDGDDDESEKKEEEIKKENGHSNGHSNGNGLSNGHSAENGHSKDKKKALTLEGIELRVPRGGFAAIVGKVGSGKSSLLSALLGELTRVRGSIKVNGRVAYVPQQAWIQNVSLRDNITFGKPFDRKLYNEVISACALKPDLAILPEGDRTEIGEKGINLSGGQKARIALARAVYQQDDVYLLDDPLSAVDAHVGRHIFHHVIGPRGLLAGKTRILVTHGLVFAKEADPVLVINEGRVIEKGRFEELMDLDGTFKRLMDEYTKSKEEEESEDEESDEDSIGDPEKIAIPGTEDDDEEKPGRIGDGRQTMSMSLSRAKTLSSPEDPDKQLIQKEGVEVGRVKTRVYYEYVRSAGLHFFLLFVGSAIAYQGFQVGRSFWLSAWSNENDPMHPHEKMDQHVRLGIYAALGTIESIWFFFSMFFLIFTGLGASRNLHTPLIHNLMRSPISFFDTTPLGRILNRCSKDIDSIDSQLPMNFRYFVWCIMQVISTLLVIIISTPLFVVVVIPLMVIYILFLRFYVPTSRQLKRLESVNRSPVYSHFGESIQGAASIRAYRRTGEFCISSEEKVDNFIRCKYLNIVSNRWLGVRLEFVGNCVIFFAALFAALSKQWGWGATAGIVGVSVSYALNITEVLNFAVRQISDIEANIVSVERVREYSETPNEAEWVDEERRPPQDWPAKGAVSIQSYSTRYRPGLDLVLKGVSADVKAGEKIGIVGRTGAGKSSFALALFRMIESAEGKIVIDGLDIADMGLHDLRKALTIIPQDPVLFSGSLRFNLDPFGDYEDSALWKALELAHLHAFTISLPTGLDHIISEGGENISVGQRQLVCLARAALRKSRILVLDEATAAVDLQTDALIQGTIRTQFKNCTVFTIAHRLNTILDYDRIMVLDKGEIAEFDSPPALMADKSSIFSRMLADAEAEQQK